MLARALILLVLPLLAATSLAQSSIDGRLLEQRGRQTNPISHCTVFAQSIDNGPLVGEYPDDEGHFVLEFPPDARVTVGTICPGYVTGTINGRATPPLTYDCSQPGPCATVEMTLEPLGVIEGQVVSGWGAPVEGVSVLLSRAGDRPRSRGFRAVSDDRGQFRLFHIPPGEYELAPTVQGPFSQGLSWDGRSQPVTVGVGDVLSGIQVPLELLEPMQLSGRIAGLPPGTKRVQLNLQRNSATNGFSTSQTVEVDDDGRFQVSGLQRGAYELSMRLPDAGDGSVGLLGTAELGEGGFEATFSIRRPAKISGVIEPIWPEREDVRSMEGSPISLVLQSDSGAAHGIQARPPDYRFQSRDLVPGDYEVSLRSGPGARLMRRIGEEEWAPFDRLTVGEGEELELALRASFEVGRLTVQVRPPDGSATKQHYVVAIRGDDGGLMIFPTDQNGKLVMRYISRGDYRIGAWLELTQAQAEDPAFWENAGDSMRRFRHEEGAEMEITLTAAP